MALISQIFTVSTLSMFLSGCFIPDAIVKSDQLASTLVQNQLIADGRLDYQAVSVHYVVRTFEDGNLVVFIHGTPGDWRIFSPQLGSDVLANSATLVALDRPGWGNSLLNTAWGDTSLSKQSALLGPVLVDLKFKYRADNLVIVGHSLGGSLVPKIAMDHPEIVDAVVVVAGDLTDDYPAARWYNNLASWKIFSWIVPGEMLKANEEVLALKTSLADMKIHWQKIKAPILVIQGEKDGLVDPRHANFAESVATNNTVKVIRVGDGDHLMHLKQSRRINRLIAQVVLREQNSFFHE